MCVFVNVCVYLALPFLFLLPRSNSPFSLVSVFVSVSMSMSLSASVSMSVSVNVSLHVCSVFASVLVVASRLASL